ncbi:MULTISPECIES: DUF5683 domain-containing protein [Aestuariibaculum]|uniref:DUF5683 domain-containing protein n=1 Tax=Aestuariibaculum lutulentum TaxID=2920935 RepID=A0ABS9RLC5_9FLAO|nr:MULTISPECIES: DUF5683 domain-containing protein [Aestuariibaculum]MCH4553755.1 DUF5683 domain-containing protein [Aestuariibaculum lutulentum]MCR8668451.1 DUF5683 domain-containing protein [Aestuariibaculum sp. M13]
MPNKLLITSAIALLFSLCVSAQEKNNKKPELPKEVIVDTLVQLPQEFNPLSPAKAAFYSAVLPGLGQAYNKRYWKIPLVYVGLGTGVYFYINNNKEYNRYRDAYKSRLAGFENDEFYFDSEGNKLDTPRVTTEGLERGQKFYRKNKEISLLVTLGIYALNIIDANVDAHLMQYNIDENLSLAPHYRFNEIDATSNLGLTFNFKF